KFTLKNGDELALQRPSASWGKMKSTPANKIDNDRLTLVNLREDAHLVCLIFTAEDEQAAMEQAAKRFRESDLFRNLSKPSPEPEAKKVGETKDMTLDVRLGGFDRTFLLRVVKMQKSGDMFLLAGGTRKGRFGRVVDDIRRSFDSFKLHED